MASSPNDVRWRGRTVARGLLCVAGALSLSCSVGVGTGEITGSVSVPDCLETESYSLNPGFFGANAEDGQLRIRIQNGGDFPLESDGISIVVIDPSTVKQERLGEAIPVTGRYGAAVFVSFYLNDSCPAMRDDLPVFLEGVDGTVTFEAIYAPEVDDSQRESRGTLDEVVFEDSTGRRAVLSGDFRFLFERGRPGQPFP